MAGSQVRKLNRENPLFRIIKFGRILKQLITLANELRTDHGSYKSTVDASRTLVNELHDDHGVLVTWVTEVDGDLDDINDYLHYLYEAGGVIGGDFDLAAGSAVDLTGSGHIRYRIGGQVYYADLDTTIVLVDSGDIVTGKYGAWRILIDRAGVVTTQDTGAQMAFDNAQDALLNLAGVAPTANTVTLGYLTVTKSDGAFDIGTTNLDAANVATAIYDVREPGKQAGGLTAALGSSVVADASAATWSVGTIDVKRNGIRLSQISAITNQAMDDADTVADTKAGGWLLVVDLAGTGVYALAADGVAGSVSAMTYADAAAVDTQLDTLANQLSELFVPIGKIVVVNASGGTFTAGTTNWDAAGITTTVTDISLTVWDRTDVSGFDSHQINPPAIPASVGAALVEGLTATKPAAGPAAISATAVDDIVGDVGD